MRRMMNIAAPLALLLSAAPAAAADKAAEHLYGPAPSWEQYRKIAEADIAGRLVDPDSARISWLGQFHKGEFKPFLQSRVAGYIGCGTVSARNRMGGYAGAVSFVVVIDYDRVLFADLDRRSTGMIAEQCNQALRAGLLPPLPADGEATGMAPAALSSTAATSAVSGLTLRAMPDGAYVTAVKAESPAATAGLKPGMVIASVNAIPLAGMGDAMLKVVDAAGADAAFTVVGGKAVKLGAK